MTKTEIESNALLEALNKSALVSAADAKGDIYYANDKFVEVSKYTREELIGKNHRILKSGLHPPEFYKELWETITNSNVWRGEIKNRAKDGSFYWVDSTIVPIVGPDGKPERYVSVRIPITEKKELEEKTKMLASIVEGTSQAWGIADLSGMMTDCNSAFLNLLGYTLPELKDINYTNLIGPEYRDAVMQGIGEMQKAKKNFVSEVGFTKKDGTTVFANLTVDFYYDEKGAPQHIYAFLNDITERKRMESKLEEHVQELGKMNKLMVGRELAMVELKKKVQELEQRPIKKE